jgi:hypothetical protein
MLDKRQELDCIRLPVFLRVTWILMTIDMFLSGTSHFREMRIINSREMGRILRFLVTLEFNFGCELGLDNDE